MEYEKAKPHLIAYIDILGTSEMLASQDYDKFYKAVQDAYQCWIAISKLENTIKVKTFPITSFLHIHLRTTQRKFGNS